MNPRRLKAFRPVVLLLLITLSCAIPALSADSFDLPVNKQIVDFGPSCCTAGRAKLYCFFYSDFVVKMYNDEGEKGAEWLSIAPVHKGTTPTCEKTHPPGEMVLDPKDWTGYFKGVKRNWVFFDADDGTNGGMPFAIYDATTGKKIFEDNAYYSGMWNQKVKDSPFNDLRVTNASDGQLSLVYLRVVEAGCNLHSQNAITCWNHVRKKLALKNARAPICSGYNEKNVLGERFNIDAESAIAYPIEVSLFPKPTTTTIAGPVKCWPVD